MNMKMVRRRCGYARNCGRLSATRKIWGDKKYYQLTDEDPSMMKLEIKKFVGDNCVTADDGQRFSLEILGDDLWHTQKNVYCVMERELRAACPATLAHVRRYVMAVAAMAG